MTRLWKDIIAVWIAVALFDVTTATMETTTLTVTEKTVETIRDTITETEKVTITLPGQNDTVTITEISTVPGTNSATTVTVTATASGSMVTTTVSGSTVSTTTQSASTSTRSVPSGTCPGGCQVDVTASVLSYPTAVFQTTATVPTAAIDVIVTELADGSRVTSTSVRQLGTPAPEPDLTWETLGLTLFYPTTYLYFTDFYHTFRTTQPGATGCVTTVASLTLPAAVKTASLIYAVDAIPTAGASPPSELIDYLNSLPTILEQLGGTPIRSGCDPANGAPPSTATSAPAVMYTRTVEEGASVTGTTTTMPAIGAAISAVSSILVGLPALSDPGPVPVPTEISTPDPAPAWPPIPAPDPAPAWSPILAPDPAPAWSPIPVPNPAPAWSPIPGPNPAPAWTETPAPHPPPASTELAAPGPAPASTELAAPGSAPASTELAAPGPAPASAKTPASRPAPASTEQRIPSEASLHSSVSPVAVLTSSRPAPFSGAAVGPMTAALLGAERLVVGIVALGVF